jgi:hypothetical protein
MSLQSVLRDPAYLAQNMIHSYHIHDCFSSGQQTMMWGSNDPHLNNRQILGQ